MKKHLTIVIKLGIFIHNRTHDTLLTLACRHLVNR
jgi:hypothetical protein